MDLQKGYIKLYRKLLDDPIYKNSKVFQLWVHILLSANHQETKILWNGEELVIHPGQLIMGRDKLAKNTGQTPQNIRTALNALKSTNKITIKSYSKFSVITVNKWEEYQVANQQTNQQLTSNQPATNQQLTTNKNDNNAKNEKNECNRAHANISNFQNINSFEELEEVPTSDPFIHHRKLEGKKVFKWIWEGWEKTRRGDIWEARETFFKCIDWNKDSELEEFKLAVGNYSNSDEVEEKIIMNLPKFIKQWRNWNADYESGTSASESTAG